MSARLLAGLLGSPVTQQAQPSKAGETTAGPFSAAADAGEPKPSPSTDAPQQGAVAEEPELVPTTSPAAPVQPEHDPLCLEPLEPQEIATLTAMLKAMARSDKEIWKRFTIAFRSQFQVPSTARTITDRVTQRRHADFIDRFERELAGVPS